MRIKFLRRVQYESEGRGKGPIYEQGSEHEFDDTFAQRWLRRGVAVVVAQAVAAVPSAKPVKPREGEEQREKDAPEKPAKDDRSMRVPR